MDSRSPAVFTYFRRPAYYAAFNSGKQITRQQRLALALLWSPGEGTLLQSQSNTADAAWGTLPRGAAQVFEAGKIDATFSSGAPSPGNRDIPGESITVEYPLGSTGSKRIVFGKDSIRVTVRSPGEFIEQIPALGSGLRLHPAPTEVSETDREVAGKRLRLLRIAAKDQLEYEIRFR